MVVIGCSKEITVDLPETETKLVVEATIEPGQPPFIILTRTQSYFAPADPASFANIFVRDAVITVHDGTTTYPIPMVCSSILTEQQLMAVALATGLDPDILANLDICLYTSLTEPATFGVVGRSYTLTIQAEGKTLTSTTTIPERPAWTPHGSLCSTRMVTMAMTAPVSCGAGASTPTPWGTATVRLRAAPILTATAIRWTPPSQHR
ncbi:MAG: DUF4249 family protein [Flavobacteriales bacterium]|nr:DUF4249 family protein [Flavobacteriales bacterium]